MRNRLFVTVAVPLFAAMAYAQDYPPASQNPSGDNSTNGGSYSNQSMQGDCSDPLMAGTPQCSGDQYGAYSSGNNLNRVPFTNSSNGSQAGRVSTYSDDQRTNSNTRSRTNNVQLAPEPLTEFQRFTASTTGTVLPIFGADLFRSVPSTFAPLDNAPVPSDYVIGPDDQLRVRIWGQVNFNADVRVDRSGDIFLPQVGSVHVAGGKFAELEQRIHDAVSKIYRNFQLSVELGQIRAIQVYVTGEARRSGVYTVSSLSTLVDALFASGGPSVQGSMRHVELRRGGATVVTLDLYRLLINGDKSQDAKLLPGDVIFIPAVGSQVAVFGSVRRPAIYELLPDDTVGSAIKYAGNQTALASDERASIERSFEHNSRQAMEVRLDVTGLSTAMRDGDILHIIPLVSKFQKTVTLRGNTANPGRFAWHEGMRLSDLIPDRESLITRDYWWKRVSLGMPAPEFEVIPALSSMRQPNSPVELLQPQSQYPHNNRDLNNSNQNPRYANGTDAYAYQNPATNVQDPNYYNQSTQYQQNLAPNDPSYAPNSQYDPRFQQNLAGTYDQRSPSARGSQSALVEEDAQSPEEINPKAPRRTSVRLSVPELDWSYAVIERMDPDTLKTTLLPFDLGKLVVQHDASQDLALMAGDIVSVFSQSDIHVPIAEQTELVHLEGEFVHSGTYSAHPGETLRSLVERAGGLTANAYLYGSVFTRESARVLQQRRIDETVHTMMLEMQRGNLALAASPVSTSQDLAGASAAQTSERALVAELQKVRATGRVVFAFNADTKGTASLPEIPLENGDTFLIPSVPSTVNAVGAIFNQNSFLFRPNAPLSSYLQLAGGPNSDADRKRMFVIRANGSVVSRNSVNGPWGNEFYRLKLNPGDTLVVPDKSLKPSALRGLIDWSQAFSQLAFGAAAISVLR